MTAATHVFTSAAWNYLGKARALFRSVRTHHPEFVCHLLVPEASGTGPELGPDEDFADVTYVTDLPGGRSPGWLFRYSLVELATAIKAPFAAALLERPDCGRVLYLDPDTVLFSRLDDVIDELATSSIVLTPHLAEPEEEFQAIVDGELGALRFGVYNLGFIGLAGNAEGLRFARWWTDRTALFGFDERPDGLFTDQKWVDLAPALFESVKVLRTPRLNVATWNLNRRPFTGSFDEGFQVSGQPLGFYHFTGYDSGAHRIMAERYAPGNHAVHSLIEWYERYTTSLAPGDPPRWSLGEYADGSPINHEHRRAYRTRRDLQARFPDPYRTDGDDTFLAWARGHVG